MNMLEIRWNDGLVILGARDAEMEGIRGMVQAAAELVHVMNSSPLFTGRIVQALSPDGTPVTPRDAANGAWTIDTEPVVFSDGTPQPVIIIELAENDQVKRWREQGHPILTVDHHGPDYPPTPSIHQVATLLLGGFKGWLIGIADHDLAIAYSLFPEETFLIRRETFGWTSEDVMAAEAYVADLCFEYQAELGVGTTPSPNNCVSDVLLMRGKAGLVPLPQSDKPGTTKFVLIGAGNPNLVKRLMDAARELGWEAYGFPNRGIGGVYVPDDTHIGELMLIF